MNPLNPLHLVLAVAVFGFGSPAFAVTPSAFDSSRKGVNSASADVPNVQTPASAPAGGSKGCMNAKSRANQIVKCVLTEDEFKGIKEKANQTILVSLSRYLGRSKHLAPNFDFAILNEAVPQWMASANSDDLSTLFMVIGNPDKDNDFSWETDPKLFDLSKSLGGKLSNQLTASLSKEPTINDAKGVKDFFTHAVAAAHKILSSRGGPTKEILHPVYSDGSSVLGWAAGAKEEAGIDDIKLLAKGRSMREMYFDDPVAEGLDPGKLHLPKMETFVCAKQDANIARDCRRLIFKVVTIRSGKEYRTGYRVYDTTNEGDIRASNFVSWTSRGDIELKSLGYKYTMHIDGNGSVKIKRTDGEPGALCLEVANGVEEAFRRRALQVRASGKIKIGTKEYYAFYQGGPVGSYLLFDVEAVNQCNDACDNIDPTTIRPAAVADVAQVNGDLVTEMKEGKLDMGALDDGSGEKKAYHLEMENGHLVAKEGPGDVEEGGEGAEIAGDDEKALDKLVSDSPPDKVLERGLTRQRGLGRIVFPERSGRLKNLDDMVQVIDPDLVRELVLAHRAQSAEHHVIGGRPYSPEPITALAIVSGVVGGQCRNPVRSGKLLRIPQMLDEPVKPIFLNHLGQQRPVSPNGLDPGQAAVAKPVTIIRRAIVPQVMVHERSKPFRLRGDLYHLLAAADLLCHSHQQLVGKNLLQRGVNPRHMAMIEPGIIAVRKPRLVIHSAPPPARPIAAIRPRPVGPQPLGIRQEDRKHMGEPVPVLKLRIVFPFRPRHQIRPGARWVEALEPVHPVLDRDLPADKPIGMLARIEIVQRALKVECPRAIAAEHRHEGGIPHEGAIVERRIDEIGDQRTPRGRLPQVAKCDLPGLPVAGNCRLVAPPARGGQQIHRGAKCRHGTPLLWKRQKYVLSDKGIGNVRIGTAHRRLRYARIEPKPSHGTSIPLKLWGHSGRLGAGKF